MRKYEFQGKTVEKAIEEGLKELGVSQFDVDIKILESGGIFKKARVEIILNDDEEVSFKDAVKEEVKKANEEKPQVKEQPKVEEEKEEEIEKEAEEIQQVIEDAQEEIEQVVEEVKAVEEEIKEAEQEMEEVEDTCDYEEEQPQEKTAKKERVYADNKGTKQFLEGLFEKLNIEANVEIVEEGEHTKALVSTEKAGFVIGHRGEMLSAIQYLANIVEQKSNRYAKRVVVDVANYRENRDDSLKDLADRMARKVLKYHKSVKLNPMNAYDRRIVHTYLQNFKGVTTHSVGTEPHRCLIIDLDRS